MLLKVVAVFVVFVYIVITVGFAVNWYEDYEHIKRDYKLGVVKGSGIYIYSLGDWYDTSPEPRREEYYTQEDVKAAARGVLLAPLWPLFLLQGFVEEARKFIIDVQGGNE